ncbi:hypothetical protein [Sinimarinibacterium flocculans]|uniref:Two component regulator with propeller domain n=1 Tax=Sinimarinibacterium flocculans TaxID=985250 RepID=A0A318EIB2_9GAMM|nr:hypothetical protein C8D93_102408 [Sinimarinibacterium flocculans]
MKRPPSEPDSRSRPPPARAVLPGESRSENRRIVLLLVLGALVGLLVEFWPEVKQATGEVVQALHEPSPDRSIPIPTAPDATARSEAGTGPDAAATGARAPDATPGAVPILSMLTGGPLREIEGMSSEAMQVALTPTGDVLMTGKYAVLELGAGDAPLRRLLYSPRRYREQFADGRSQAMASALLLADGRYLLGGWHGEVLMGRDETLHRLSAREDRPKGRIVRMLAWNGHVLVAGDGLWRLDDEGGQLREITLPGASRLDAVGAGESQLLLADSGRRILAWDGDRAEPWMQWPDDAGRVEALVPAREGGWWVGSTRGLFRVGDDRQIRVVLPGVWVTGIVDRADESWIGTWKQGLLLRRDDRWYRLGTGIGGLADESVNALTVDAQEHLWLALYGGGGWRAPLPALRDRIMRHPWVPEADPAP